MPRGGGIGGCAELFSAWRSLREPPAAQRSARGEFARQCTTKKEVGHLHQVWPLSVPVDLLVQAARTLMGGDAASEPHTDRMTAAAEELRSGLIRCYRQKRWSSVHFRRRLWSLPAISPPRAQLARSQAIGGNTVTNLRHEAGQLNEFGERSLPCWMEIMTARRSSMRSRRR